MTWALNGAQVLVTRPAAQADKLCKLIEKQGGLPLRFPTLEIVEASPDPELLVKAAACDWLIFTSINAVDFAIKAFGGKMAGLNVRHIAAVGQATAEALTKQGVRVDCVPATEFNSEGLLAEAALQNLAGQSCLIVRGVGGREKLADGLRSRGAWVGYLEVYRRCLPNADNRGLVEQLRERKVSATTVTSGEALQNLLAMLDSQAVDLLRALPLIVVSDRIAEIARDLGFERVAVSRQPSDAAILETLTTLLNGENSGRSN